MIYTVTVNPALDYAMEVGELIPGRTNRSKGEQISFGGKGINVSAILTELGVPTLALGFVAGFTGEALERAVSRAGVKCEFVRLREGYTRINVKLKGDEETEINAEGPMVYPEALEVFLQKLDRIGEGDTLVLAGSLPRSLPGDLYCQILHRLDGRGIRFVVDATGELLLSTLPYRPFLIKPNRHELEELAGRSLVSEDDIADFARTLQVKGAKNVLVSLGGDGAILLDEFGMLHRKAAVGGPAVNTVGAGDSMVAGFLKGCEVDYDYALRMGIAAGGATAHSMGLATKEEILALL